MLLVEDDPDLRQLLQDVIAAAGHTADCVMTCAGRLPDSYISGAPGADAIGDSRSAKGGERQPQLLQPANT